MPTKIEWCQETINPIQDKIKGKTGRGYHCTKVSAGCLNCYAEGINKRFGNGIPFDGRDAEFELIESELEKPIKWRKPKRIFVQSMGDIFHEKVPFSDMHKIWNIASKCQHHIFLFLTKRPERMLEFTKWMAGADDISIAHWPRNCWCGITAENQQIVDERIPILLQIPAAVRFVSIEPMLSKIWIQNYLNLYEPIGKSGAKIVGADMFGYQQKRFIDWIIVGTESGHKKRPAKIEWVRNLRDQCVSAGVPFFLKQAEINGKVVKMPELDGKTWSEYPK